MKVLLAGAVLAATSSARPRTSFSLYPHSPYSLYPTRYIDLDATCAQVKFEGFSGIEGTLDMYQPNHGPTLLDASFKDLQRDQRYEVVIKPLSPTYLDCSQLGPVTKSFGTVRANRKGFSKLQRYLQVDVEDLIGKSVVIQSNDDSRFSSSDTKLLDAFDTACGTVVEVPCPHAH